MNGDLSIGNMIRFSLKKSGEILSPFNFKRWFKILIIVSFAGAGIPGFGMTFNKPNIPVPAAFAPRKITVPKFSPIIPRKALKRIPPVSPAQTPVTPGASATSTGQISLQPQEKAKAPSIGQDVESIVKLKSRKAPLKRKANPFIVALQMMGMIFLGIGSVALIIFFLWLSSRLNFVLLNTLITKEPSIKEPFTQNKEIGNSYFRWSLIFLGSSFFIVLVLGLIGAGMLVVAKGNAGFSTMLVVFAIPLGIAIFLAIVAIGTLMHDFVLPIMYREKISAMSAMDKFLKAGTIGFGKIVQYLLIVFGLWILAVIAQTIVAIFIAVGGLIAGGIVAIPGLVLIKILPLLKVPLIVLGVFVVIALILGVIMVIGMVMLPAVIFFRVFALAYLTRIHPSCDLLGFSGKAS